MTTIEEQRRIYRGILNAEKHARYYGFGATFLKGSHVIVSIVILVSTSGAIIAALEKWPHNSSVWFLGAVALLTIVDVVADFSGRAASARHMKNECRKLANQWERLWENRNDKVVLEQAGQLENRLEIVTSEDFIVIDLLNKHFGRKANDVIKARLTPQRQTSPS